MLRGTLIWIGFCAGIGGIWQIAMLGARVEDRSQEPLAAEARAMLAEPYPPKRQGATDLPPHWYPCEITSQCEEGYCDHPGGRGLPWSRLR